MSRRGGGKKPTTHSRGIEKASYSSNFYSCDDRLASVVTSAMHDMSLSGRKSKSNAVVMNHFLLEESKTNIYFITLEYGEVKLYYQRIKMAKCLVEYINRIRPSCELCFCNGGLLSLTRIEPGIEVEVEIGGTMAVVKTADCLENFDKELVYNNLVQSVFFENGYRRVGSVMVNKVKSNVNLNGAVVYNAFRTSVCRYLYGGKYKLALLIDPCYKVFNSKSIWSLIQGKQESQVKKMLVGKRVITYYNMMSYVVKGVEWGMDPFTLKFYHEKWCREVSYSEYYHLMMNIKLVRNKGEPMLAAISVRGGNTVYLIPQLCNFVEIDNISKRELPIKTSIKPQQRVTQSIELSWLLGREPVDISCDASGIWKRLGIKVANRPIETRPSEVLNLPYLKLSPFNGVSLRLGSNWASNLSNLSFQGICKIPIRVHVVYNGDINIARVVEHYSQCIFREFERSPLQAVFNKSDIKCIRSFANLDPKNLNQSNCKPAEVLILAFLCEKNELERDRNYASIHLFGVRNGYQIQCLDFSVAGIRKKFTSPDRSQVNKIILNNIVRQIINKFGFDGWKLDIAKSLPVFQSKPLLLIGTDTSVSSTIVNRPQVQNFQINSSSNAYFAMYFDSLGENHYHSTIMPQGDQNRNQPIKYSTVDFVHECLTKFTKSQSIAQKTIVVVIKDGVDRGEAQKIINTEINTLENIPNVEIIYVTTQKRINTRFVLVENNGIYNNVEPGSIFLDGTLTNDEFYLVPLGTNLSTSRPIHYNVLKRPNSIPLNELKNLIWCLKSQYQNWSGIVNIPSVVKYAHKLSFLASKMFLIDNFSPNPSLSSKLYFL